MTDQENSTIGIPPAVLFDLIEQYQHRIFSLEADLKDQARTGEVSRRAFAKRAKRLAAMQQQLGQMRAVRENCLESEKKSRSGWDVGLPVASECTPTEIAVCERFIEEKSRFVSSLEKESRRVLDWVRKVVAGKSNGFVVTWRLSKIRAKMESVEARTQMVLNDSVTIDAYIERFVCGFGRDLSKYTVKGTVEGLITVFTQLDHSISKVAKLRATLGVEKKRLQRMNEWLLRRRQALRQAGAQMAPPTPLSTARAGLTDAQAARPRSPVTPGFDRQRLTLAKNLLAQLRPESPSKPNVSPPLEPLPPEGNRTRFVRKTIRSRGQRHGAK